MAEQIYKGIPISYQVFVIPKRNGKKRILEVPNPKLMEKQKEMQKYLMNVGLSAGNDCHAYTKGRSHKTYADVHKGHKFFYKADLRNFFWSCKRHWLEGMRYKTKRLEPISDQRFEDILEICFWKGRLPMGAPTSPILSNLMFTMFDKYFKDKITEYYDTNYGNSPRRNMQHSDEEVRSRIKEIDFKYGRYADDLVFSANQPLPNWLVDLIDNRLWATPFFRNRQKGGYFNSRKRVRIANLVVNDKPNIAKETAKKTRARIHNMKINLLKGKVYSEKEWESLEGLVLYYNQINSKFIKMVHEVRSLKQLEKLNKKLTTEISVTEESLEQDQPIVV